MSVERSCSLRAANATLRAVVKVAFIGAGSIEFTRNVVTDLCGYPELGRGPALRAARHQPGAAGVRRGADPRDRRADRRGRAGQRVGRARAGAGRRPLRHQRGAGRRVRLDARGLRDPGPVRRAADDRRHARASAGYSAACGRSRSSPRWRRTCSATARSAYLLNYSNPMAMLPWAVYAGTGFRNVFGLCHSVRDTHAFLAGLVGADPARRPVRHRGLQPSGVRAAV